MTHQQRVVVHKPDADWYADAWRAACTCHDSQWSVTWSEAMVWALGHLALEHPRCTP